MPDRLLRRRARRSLRRWRRRSDPAALLAAVWAWRALTRLRRELPAQGTAVRPSPPPRLPARGLLGVQAVARRREATCLERCLLLQAWLLAQGEPHDVVIGVGAPGEEFAAHAWLAGWRPDPESERYRELTRLGPVRP